MTHEKIGANHDNLLLVSGNLAKKIEGVIIFKGIIFNSKRDLFNSYLSSRADSEHPKAGVLCVYG